MKSFLMWGAGLAVILIPTSFADAQKRQFVTGSRLSFGTEIGRSASVRVADFTGNGRPDLVVANGRHWPGQNSLLLNYGNGRMTVQRDVGADRSTSYAAEPADLDGDGDLDLLVGNDQAPNRIFINDGAARFQAAGVFGEVSSVRSLEVADIDGDGDVDVLVTCRGRQNYFCLNDGRGEFGPAHPFGTSSDSTIDLAVVDWNGDGHSDLVLANRDGQRNSILINDGRLNFESKIPFGALRESTRGIAAADFNGDGRLDLAVANIDRPNRIYFGDADGGIGESVEFGLPGGRTYCLAVADMDNDEDVDVIVGNVGQSNAVFFNEVEGKSWTAVRFGESTTATYGLDVGDLDQDGFADVAVANSGSPNSMFLNRPDSPQHPKPEGSKKVPPKPQSIDQPIPAVIPSNRRLQDSDDGKKVASWRSFRGNDASGVAEGSPVRGKWNADPASGEVDGVRWSTPVPGLGHSSPVIQGDRLFLLSAIAADGNAPLKVGRGGQPDAADDQGEQTWVVLCYDRHSGKELWRRTAWSGVPRATRHAKATHANASVAVQGDHVVAFFGSEGIHCFDLQGNLRWSRDLGMINISKYGIGWGFASSPAIHQDRIAIVCDDPDHPFAACLKLSDGQELWRADRKEICERSWGTPLIHHDAERTQVVVNGWPWIVSYDFETGQPLWRIRGGGDNPVPTPFESEGAIYITNAHGAEAPIFVVRPSAEGDITPEEDTGASEGVIWSVRRGGSYMSTPVVYGEYLYLGNTNGVLRCFHASTGEKVYEKRLGSGASIIGSLVAADGKVFCPSENGKVYVVRAGAEFDLVAVNEMGDPCFATPAIVEGTLYIRTTKALVAIR